VITRGQGTKWVYRFSMATDGYRWLMMNPSYAKLIEGDDAVTRPKWF
jgi:hypothetical protein